MIATDIAIMALLALAPLSSEIEGDWRCGPYEVVGQMYQATVEEQVTYGSDGSYESEGVSTYVFMGDIIGDERVVIEASFAGEWRLEAGQLLRRLSSQRVVSTDHPAITAEVIQAMLDETEPVGDWVHYELRETGERLVTYSASARREEARVEVSCVRKT